MIGSPMLTLLEAAFLMGITEEQLQKLIDDDQILVVKSQGMEPPIIHESEVHRFLHPWQHIFRLDKRVDATQQLVETLKKSAIVQLETDIALRLNCFDKNIEEMRRDLQFIKAHLFPPKIAERKAVPAKQNKSKSKSRK
jgi:hypothetical protein